MEKSKLTKEIAKQGKLRKIAENFPSSTLILK